MNKIFSGISRWFIFCVLSTMFVCGSVYGYDLAEKFSIGGVISGAYQYQGASDMEDNNFGRGAVAVQPEFSFHPNKQNEIFAKFGFGVGNGVPGKTEFLLSPWAADLEDEVKDINGRNRDYLLTAWYKYTFEFAENHTLGFTGGIIDATDYLDENAFANDELTQFMNEALVNSSTAFLPSYDIGGAGQWAFGGFSVNTVVMDIGENDNGKNYQYYGAQIAYQSQTNLGEGNYRIIAGMTSDSFLNDNGTDDNERLSSVILSLDQAFGETFGGWVRLSWQNDAAAIDFESLISGGIHISGSLWGREQDNIGIGYAYLDGGNLDVKDASVFETYLNLGLNEYLAATLDIQYQDNNIKDAPSPDGWVYGVRLTAEF